MCCTSKVGMSYTLYTYRGWNQDEWGRRVGKFFHETEMYTYACNILLGKLL